MSEDQWRLGDILEAINQIEKYSVRGRHAFESDELIQVWIVHRLETIGEAARYLSNAVLRGYPHVPCRQTFVTRNILAH